MFLFLRQYSDQLIFQPCPKGKILRVRRIHQTRLGLVIRLLMIIRIFPFVLVVVKSTSPKAQNDKIALLLSQEAINSNLYQTMNLKENLFWEIHLLLFMILIRWIDEIWEEVFTKLHKHCLMNMMKIILKRDIKDLVNMRRIH